MSVFITIRNHLLKVNENCYFLKCLIFETAGDILPEYILSVWILLTPLLMKSPATDTPVCHTLWGLLNWWSNYFIILVPMYGWSNCFSPFSQRHLLLITIFVKYMKSIPETQKMKQFSAQSSHEPGGQHEGLWTDNFDKRWRHGGERY